MTRPRRVMITLGQAQRGGEEEGSGRAAYRSTPRGKSPFSILASPPM